MNDQTELNHELVRLAQGQVELAKETNQAILELQLSLGASDIILRILIESINLIQPALLPSMRLNFEEQLKKCPPALKPTWEKCLQLTTGSENGPNVE